MVPNSWYYFTFVDKCPVVGQEQVKEVAGILCYERGCTDYLVEECIFDNCKELGTLGGIGSLRNCAFILPIYISKVEVSAQPQVRPSWYFGETGAEVIEVSRISS